MGSPFATTSSTPFFGRAWKLQIITSNGTILTAGAQTFDVNDESLKVTFETSVQAGPAKSAYAYCDISIYNLNRNTQQALLAAFGTADQPLSGNDIIQQANLVSLFAGYQTDFNSQSLDMSGFGAGGFGPTGKPSAASSSLIWTGEVYMPLWERVDVTDYKLTLHCLIGYAKEATNFVSASLGPNCTGVNIIQAIASAATTGISVGDISDLEASPQGTAKLPFGKILYGRPGDIAANVARTAYSSYYIGPNGINVRTLAPSTAGAPPQWVYGPAWPGNVAVQPKYPLQYTPTLIGSPQQTQDGVVFRVLIDSRVKLGDIVALDLSAINQLPQYPYTGQRKAFIDQNFTYVVAQIRHVGDTRGQDWYTEITAIGSTFWYTYSQFGPAPQTN